MRAREVEDLTRLRASGASATAIKARQALTKKWIAGKNAKLAEFARSIRAAIDELGKSAVYQALEAKRDADGMAYARLRVGERVAATNAEYAVMKKLPVQVVTFQRVMMAASLAVAAYHSFQWWNSLSRTKDPVDRADINKYYGVKVLCDVLYMNPWTAAARATIDMGGSYLAEPVISAINESFGGSHVYLADSEQIITGFVNWVENKFAPRCFGSSHFKILLSEQESGLEIPVVWLENCTQNGQPIKAAVNFYLRQLIGAWKDASAGRITSAQKVAAREKFRRHLDELTLKYVALLFYINARLNGGVDREFGAFEQTLTARMVGWSQPGYVPIMGFLTRSASYLKATR